jgi:arginyl-tRNA synthetase
VREQVESRLRRAVETVLREIDPGHRGDLRSISVVLARNPEHGDFACNGALALSKKLGLQPRELAARIVAALGPPDDVIERTEIAGPGFINVFLSRDRWHDSLARVLREGERYGLSNEGRGELAQVEFVSANPTGPLTIGHGRNAVLGDAVARLLEAVGYEVSREYYFNDGGRQMRLLGESLRARYEQQLGREAAIPEEGYQGEYLIEIAARAVEEHGESWLSAEDDQFKELAQRAIFEDIEATLERLRIRFDSHFNEHTLYRDDKLELVLRDLRTRGVVYDKDGAVWLRSTDFGHERDRVLVKSNGEPTYLLPDIAYHRDKLERGYRRIIDVFGPDHIEQFPYLKLAMKILDLDFDALEVVVYQWVNLRRGGELVRMSTRRASFVTIDEVLGEVGPDVFRYFMLERRADTPFDFDLDLARERSDRNPVYKIQYAHARMCSIERKAAEQGVALPEIDQIPFARLDSGAEIELVKQLGAYPEQLQRAARAREPQEVARYVLELATSFHTYISDGSRHRVLSDDRDLSTARLALVRAVRTTLANGLGILGISAPERM